MGLALRAGGVWHAERRCQGYVVSSGKLVWEIEESSSDIIGWGMVSHRIDVLLGVSNALFSLSRSAECGLQIVFRGERWVHGEVCAR